MSILPAHLVVRDRTSSPVLDSNSYSSTGEAIGEGKLDELGGNSYKYDCTDRRVTWLNSTVGIK